MQKILFVSVGGSYQPIVKAIESLNPQRTVFFCSKGSACPGNRERLNLASNGKALRS